jgi:hypothetical protein
MLPSAWLLTCNDRPNLGHRSHTQEANTITSRKKLAALQQRVRVLCPGTREAPQTEAAALKLLHTRGTDAVGFLQFFNKYVPSICSCYVLLSSIA